MSLARDAMVCPCEGKGKVKRKGRCCAEQRKLEISGKKEREKKDCDIISSPYQMVFTEGVLEVE